MQAEYCVIYCDPWQEFKWTRSFFHYWALAENFKNSLPGKSRAFIRQHVVVTGSSKNSFYTKREAEAEAAKQNDKIPNSAGVTVLNPGYDGPPELLYG